MSQLRTLLEEGHRDLHQWFLLHQECLLLRQDDHAQLAMQAFADYLLAHIGFENTHLLDPAGPWNASLRWNVTVYRKEHEKLAGLLKDIREMLGHYYPLQGRSKRLALLEVLDRQQSLYHVMEHHEQREEQDLFGHLHLLEAPVEEAWLQLDEQLCGRYGSLKQELKQMLESA